MKSRGVEPESESNQVQCWGENPNAQMLRLELRDGTLCLCPYAWLERVQFSPAEKADRATLVFNGLSISITGERLRELVLAFQRMAVEWVKEEPERFQVSGASNEVFVDAIEIVEGDSSLAIGKRGSNGEDHL